MKRKMSSPANKKTMAPAIKELITLSIIFILMATVFFVMDVAEDLEIILEKYESFQLDELILVAAFFSFFLSLFSYRRWQELKRELQLRISTDNALEKVNIDLKCKALELERHSRGISSLAKLANFLQVCKSRDEAFNVIKQAANNLFFGVDGALYITRESRNQLELGFQWGSETEFSDFFSPNDCWGLRLGKKYVSKHASEYPLCTHAVKSEKDNHICLPLTAHGEILGLLYLHYNENIPEEKNPPECKQKEFEIEDLAEAFSEQVSLTLSNIDLNDKLQNLAVHDPLTGLYNRIHLNETFERELHRAHRRQSQIGVMMMDLDHFKRINDTYGHGAGDIILQSVGQVLKNFFRSEDFCCRYGGEEFLILLPEVSTDDLRNKADALRQKINSLKPVYLNQSVGKISVSIGIAVYPDHGENITQILQAADEMLYKAKQDGRDRVCVVKSQSD